MVVRDERGRGAATERVLQYSSMSSVLTAARARAREASIIAMTSAKACSSDEAETVWIVFEADSRLTGGVDDFLGSSPHREARHLAAS